MALGARTQSPKVKGNAHRTNGASVPFWRREGVAGMRQGRGPWRCPRCRQSPVARDRVSTRSIATGVCHGNGQRTTQPRPPSPAPWDADTCARPVPSGTKHRPLLKGPGQGGRGGCLGPWSAPADPPCDSPSGCCFFTGPWTVTRSSLRMLRRVAAFCRPLRPVLPLVLFPRSRSPVVGVLGLC